MLVLSPQLVRFDSLSWSDVSHLAVDRLAAREAVEWTDLGPHPTFADVPEQRTVVQVVRRVDRGDPAAPTPGQLGTLSFEASPTGTHAAKRTHSAQCVVLNVRHELRSGPRGPAAVQTIELVALSSDGAADPIAVAE